MSSWCFDASISSSSSSPSPSVKVTVKRLIDDDQSTSRDWMEHMESQSYGGGPGAYDVLRCDIVPNLNSHSGDNDDLGYNLWGLEYHLSRLQMSFRELVNSSMNVSMKQHRDGRGLRDTIDEHCLDSAVVESKAIIRALLSRGMASTNILREFYSTGMKKNKNRKEKQLLCVLVKVTLLWTPSILPNVDPIHKVTTPHIIVRGHASTDGKIIDLVERPQYIIARLALPPPGPTSKSYCNQTVTSNNNDHERTCYTPLPDRNKSPHAKISSWARERKPLEKKETFQPDGVSEILMLGCSDEFHTGEKSSTTSLHCCLHNNYHDQDHHPDYQDQFEILEGTTSNFFAIYKDNTIRTAQIGVLFGYVRNLILRYASNCGLTLDSRPCFLEDGANGLWAEVFITSSSRLIYPIRKILIPNYEKRNNNNNNNNRPTRTSTRYKEEICNVHNVSNDGKNYNGIIGNDPIEWNEFWSYKGCTDNGLKEGIQPNTKWEHLFDELLRHGGYFKEVAKESF